MLLPCRGQLRAECADGVKLKHRTLHTRRKTLQFSPRLIMKSKPESFLRFAVNRADILSRLPGVQLAAGEKRFARGRPKLDPNRACATRDAVRESHAVAPGARSRTFGLRA
jgi:hypothetical protein